MSVPIAMGRVRVYDNYRNTRASGLKFLGGYLGTNVGFHKKIGPLRMVGLIHPGNGVPLAHFHTKYYVFRITLENALTDLAQIRCIE